MARQPMTKESRAAAQRKYSQSAKGKAASARYCASDRKRAANERWQSSESGKEAARERMRKWRALNPDKAREQTREALRRWRDENRESFRLHCRKRRNLEREAEGSHTAKDIKALFVTQGGRCLCGADLRSAYHVDHMTPLSRGGSDWPENLQLLCPSCNHSKRDRTMIEWDQSKFTTC